MLQERDKRLRKEYPYYCPECDEDNDERWRDREQCGMYNRKDHAGSQLQP